MATYHALEERAILAMKPGESYTVQELAENAKISPDQARRAVEWLKQKGEVRRSQGPQRMLYLGPRGIEAQKGGLPEAILLRMLAGGASHQEARRRLQSDWGAAVGICCRNGWIRMDGGRPAIVSYPDKIPHEDVLELDWSGGVAKDMVDESFARRPGFTVERSVPARYLLASAEVLERARARQSGTGRPGGALDVEADAARIHAARTHPLHDVISEIRETFVTLGFEEIAGAMVQPAFWNFDALFTPQDHPAREMQDTYYVRGGRVDANPLNVEEVARTHQKCWRYRWDPDRAAESVLRTHTTCVTIQHLARARPERARLFSLGRVFRNEKPSYKHLVEFHQVEGVVADPTVSLRDLMGIQREFYHRMGLKKVKFWPTFFPYTEPSLQSMVYNETLHKWVELFGMGIFRPEVTGPLGIRDPVLAWGGGIERIAMMRYDMDDVRDFYRNDLGWLRGVPACR